MKKFLFWLCLLLLGKNGYAHPMPSSIVHLILLEHSITGEANIPLIELANAVGDKRVANMADPFFKTYFADHIKATSSGRQWHTEIKNIHVVTGKDPMFGTYQEAVVQFTLTPPEKHYLRTFNFNYDAVIHQVVTHSALVYVVQDWSNGIQEKNKAQQIGAIGMDVPSGKIYPLQVNLEAGNWWKGFKSMLALGMQHIQEGTDHLLFLLVLLLPGMLLVNGKQWGAFGGFKFSLLHLLKIVTAFTIGHSITLIAGALGWVQLPGQPVEILIAVSILVSAVHAVRPLFPGKETYVAAGFGLVHGLAFATVLSGLELSSGKLALSILGFNLGIELMQLFVMAITVPWFMLLSKTPVYKWIRIATATLAAIAAVAWITERSSGKNNLITLWLEQATQHVIWYIVALAAGAVIIYIITAPGNRKARLMSKV